MDPATETEIDRAGYLAAVVESSDDAIFTKTLDETITQWNKGAEKMYGYTAQEAVGRSVSMLIPPGRDNDLPDILARITKGQHVEHYETERIHRNGRIIFVSLGVSPIYDRKGLLIGAATIARDITEHKRLEDALLNNARLEAGNKILDSFSHAIAHELRNPLTALKSSVFLMRENYWEKLDAPGRKLLEIAGQETEIMIGIVGDLQDLVLTSRPVRQDVAVDLSALALAEVERRTISHPERRVDWRIADGLVARGDPGLLRLALSNLLRNACKYTAKKPNPIIEFGMLPREGPPVYFVRDNGVGFDMKDVPKLFQPFSRLHTEKDFAGTGIGLTIVEKVVRRHNGRVWAEGKVQGGATFYFTLAAE